MKRRKHHHLVALVLLLASTGFTGCLTSKRMDSYVASQFGNELPRLKKNKADITVNSVYSSAHDEISNTVQKTSHFLPLIVYFQFDYRHTCTLNPQIGVTEFANNVGSQYAKISQQLGGRTLELTVEQVPSAFAIADKAHLLLLVIHWDRVFVDPDFKDLVVSYKLLQNNSVVKTGKIDVKNHERDRNVGVFQSWKSSVREYLSTYNADMTSMSKEFVTQLLNELQQSK